MGNVAAVTVQSSLDSQMGVASQSTPHLCGNVPNAAWKELCPPSHQPPSVKCKALLL